MSAAAEVAGVGASPESAAMDHELGAALAQALAELKPSDAATLLAYARGERPDASPGATFRKRVERALARLRAMLKSAQVEQPLTSSEEFSLRRAARSTPTSAEDS